MESIYGTAEPGWIGSKKLDWMPKGEAAWSAFTAGKEKILAAVGGSMGGRHFANVLPSRITLFYRDAGVVELVDTGDLKSPGL